MKCCANCMYGRKHAAKMVMCRNGGMLIRSTYCCDRHKSNAQPIDKKDDGKREEDKD